MFQRFSVLLLSALLVLATQSLAGAAKPLRYLRPTQLQMRQWIWVGHCETHDRWTMVGTLYTGALGITRTNWLAYGGTQFAPIAAWAKPWQQVVIAMRIQGKYPAPDQPTSLYCNPKGW